MTSDPFLAHPVGSQPPPRSQASAPAKVLILLLMLAALWALWPNASRAAAQPGTAPNPTCVNVINTGGGSCLSGPVQLTPQEQALLAKKNALAQEYAQVRAGKLSASLFQRDYQAFLQQYGGPSAQQPFASPASCPSIATGSASSTQPLTVCISKDLYVPQQPQANNYYCGPATAEEILSGLGWTTGPHGESLSQSVLANTNYLHTDADGGTNWNPYVMGPTLNAWTRSSFYAPVNGSGVGGGFTVTTFTYDLTTDIDNGWPLVGNIVEYSGTNNPHLVGHPQSATIYHWIAIRGYNNYGSTTDYADSISGDSWIWPWAVNVPPYSSISSSAMTTLLNGKGYIW